MATDWLPPHKQAILRKQREEKEAAGAALAAEKQKVEEEKAEREKKEQEKEDKQKAETEPVRSHGNASVCQPASKSETSGETQRPSPPPWPKTEPRPRMFQGLNKWQLKNTPVYTLCQIIGSHAVVCSPDCFFEGNYDTALRAVIYLFRRLDIEEWLSKSPEDSLLLHDLPPSKIEARGKAALSLILAFVPTVAKKIRKLEGITTCYELLQKLKDVCKPFRLMDLPKKLRRRIYDHFNEFLENPDVIYSDGGGAHGYREILHDDNFAIFSSVCKEFREAATRIYFSQNHFELRFHDLDEVDGFARFIGHNRLKYLRNLTIVFDSCAKGFFSRFDVSFNEQQGVQAKYTSFHEFEPEVEECSKHTDMINRRRVEEKWDSTGVIEFFIIAQEGLRASEAGSAYRKSYLEEVNERDADQIQFGECIRSTFW